MLPVDVSVQGAAGRSLSFGTPRVIERSKGNATTDFGAPSIGLADDGRTLRGSELARLTSILQACWRAFDRAAKKAEGVSLQTGPRGGGRSVTKMRAHVLEGDQAYLGKIGGSGAADLASVRRALLDALAARARGELPDVGPRGGARWSARYAIRRSAWHALDHAWEIEDRS